MTEKSSSRRTFSSTTHTWDSLDKLPPEQRASIEKLLGGKMDMDALQREWGHDSSGAKDEFVVEINDDAVTVNGHHYDSIDDVPEPERQRVQALRDGFGVGGSLKDLFRDSGPNTTAASASASRPETLGKPGRAADGFTASPGAVAPSSATRRLGQGILIVICAGVAWMAARWLHLV